MFLPLFLKILPLYFIALLGYIAGRYLNIKAADIGKLNIFLIVPIVSFFLVAEAKISYSYLWLPFILLLQSMAMNLFGYNVLGKLWSDKTKNLLGMCCGNANNGYFGLPVALMLFEPDLIGIFVLMGFGFTLAESTLGYYFLARGHYTPAKAIKKLLQLPVVYSIILGLLVNFYGLKLSSILTDTLPLFRGTYVVLGIMIIGVALAENKGFQMDLKFVITMLVVKFIIWPIFTFGLILIDRRYTHWFDENIYAISMLLAILPMASNSVTYSAKFNIHPEKAATAVLISLLFALVFIPVYYMY